MPQLFSGGFKTHWERTKQVGSVSGCEIRVVCKKNAGIQMVTTALPALVRCEKGHNLKLKEQGYSLNKSIDILFRVTILKATRVPNWHKLRPTYLW